MTAATTDLRPAILRRAAEILKTNGRFIGDYYDFDQYDSVDDPSRCRVCVLGAIALAAGCDLRTHSLGDPQTAAEDLAIDAARALADRLCLLGPWEDPGSVIQAVSRWHDGSQGDPAPADADLEDALLNTADALERETR